MIGFFRTRSVIIIDSRDLPITVMGSERARAWKRGKNYGAYLPTEEKWNAAFSAVKSQFEVVDVLPEQQEAIKSFFFGGGGRRTTARNLSQYR